MTDWPAEGMPDCCMKVGDGQTPVCPYHSEWKSAGFFSDHMNWLFIFCDKDIMEHSNGRLARCQFICTCAAYVFGTVV
jgi:hypothetical protein